jgi:hypothetical protein
MSSCPCKLWSKLKFSRKLTDAFKVIAEIKAVENGVKPGWLNDICSIDFDSMNFLLKMLRDQKAISPELIALKLDEDILVANIETLIYRINRSIKKLSLKKDRKDNDDIDINTLDEPIFFYFNNTGQCLRDLPYTAREHLSCMLTSLLESLKCLKDYQGLEFDSSSFTPTLFGIVLGYPFVYVINQEVETHASNTMNLYVTEVQIEIPLGFTCSQHSILSQQSVCYSFSIPLSNLSYCKGMLDEWKKVFIQTLNSNNVIKYNFNTKIRNNIQVIL